jgi:hypothetical protein
MLPDRNDFLEIAASLEPAHSLAGNSNVRVFALANRQRKGAIDVYHSDFAAECRGAFELRPLGCTAREQRRAQDEGKTQ